MMGGGSAGHLFPSVAVAQRLQLTGDCEVLFIGAQGRLDAKILADHNLQHELIPAAPFPYGMSLKTIPALFALWRSVGLCKGILERFRPDVVFGAGGFVSVAGVLAAARTGIPRVCHVSDAQPDRANRLLARWATRITAHYPVAAQQFGPAKTVVTGQPVRREFLETTRDQARAALGLPADAFVLTVAGGSQGARTLNYATLGALRPLLADPRVHVIHLTGALDHPDILSGASEAIGPEPRYRCMEFCERPWEVYAATDLCLTRGGAGSLAELAVMGVPMIAVPYPFAAAHQRLNAAPLADSGAAVVVENADLTADSLVATVTGLRGDPGRLARMSAAARAASHPQAAEQIAGVLRDAARTHTRLTSHSRVG